ncbi:MAG TPA: hypothetical protein VEH30_13090 [Terriglobales bacterium]|nr:hypothetical protein [Terriglobales bacterium]
MKTIVGRDLTAISALAIGVVEANNPMTSTDRQNRFVLTTILVVRPLAFGRPSGLLHAEPPFSFDLW